MDKVFVLGGAQTDFERNWKKEGKNFVGLLRENLTDSLQAVGLSLGDIRDLNRDNRVGCFVGNFIAEKYVEQGHLGSFLTEVDPAFYGVPSARYEAACASGSAALDAAICKVGAGEYDLAVVTGWELMKTVDSRTGGDFLGRAAYYEKEAKGLDFPFPRLFGQLADQLLVKYGLEESRLLDALAMISAKNYGNAKRNPNAQTRNWFMNFAQASSRGTPTNAFVGGKLAVSDCSQVTDGAATVFLASARFLQERGLSGLPVVKGYGHRVAPLEFAKKMEDNRGSRYILPWTRQTVLDAYRRSGLTLDDIDVFETHDCFTSSEYAAISAFGITEPGREFEALEDGTVMFGGKKPVNPSGGLIGGGHPVGATGVRMFLDLYKQVSEQAGAYQVRNVRNAMMLNFGGSATTNYAFVVGRE